MSDRLAEQAIAEGADPAVASILARACEITRMGFVALARVTEDRWIACQVVDKIDFGLDPGGELDLKKTICNDVRECGATIVIDEVAIDPDWRTHPVPALYGFESYASLPIFLRDGSFYGTLCAIDPEPRALSARDTVERLRELADELGEILSGKAKTEEA